MPTRVILSGNATTPEDTMTAPLFLLLALVSCLLLLVVPTPLGAAASPRSNR